MQLRWGLPAHDCDVFIPQGATIAELHEVIAIAQDGEVRIEVEQFAFDETPLGLRTAARRHPQRPRRRPPHRSSPTLTATFEAEYGVHNAANVAVNVL